MTKRFVYGLLLASLSLPVFSGCNRDPGPPPPMAAEQLPAEFDKGFKSAKPEVKELAGKVVSAVQAKDYPAAFAAVQSLATVPGTTRPQQSLAARALITITCLLQTAQSQGDEKAAEVMKEYRSMK